MPVRSKWVRLALIGTLGLLGAQNRAKAPAEVLEHECLTQQALRDLNDPQNILVAPTECRWDHEQGRAGGTLRMLLASDPRGMNPYIANGADVTTYGLLMSDYLAERDRQDPDRWVPRLATKVVTPDNGLTYILTLQEGVYWQLPNVDWSSGGFDWLKGSGPDGRHPLTADDFVFVFDALANEQVGGRISSLRQYYEAVESVEALDEHTLKVTYSERQFTNLAMLLELWPMPRWLFMFDECGQEYGEEVWGQALNTHWHNNLGFGVGPYRLARWTAGEELRFEKDPLYWGETPSFDVIQYRVLWNQEMQVAALQSGEVDIGSIQPNTYKLQVVDSANGEVLGDPELRSRQYETLTYFYMGWNHDRPQFADKRVRQAMTLAFDRERIVREVFHGLGTVHTGPFPKQLDCYDDSIAPWPFDLKAAAAKLDEAGWRDSDGDGVRDKVLAGDRVPLRFTLLSYGGSSEYEQLLAIWQEDLRSVGVDMQVEYLAWADLLQRMDARDFGAYTGAWVPGWDTDLMQIWHSSEADKPQSSNRVGFRNEVADRIAEELRRTMEPGKRTELCHEFHALVHEEQPYTFFYQRRRPLVWRSTLTEPRTNLQWPYQDPRFWSFAAQK